MNNHHKNFFFFKLPTKRGTPQSVVEGGSGDRKIWGVTTAKEQAGNARDAGGVRVLRVRVLRVRGLLTVALSISYRVAPAFGSRRTRQTSRRPKCLWGRTQHVQALLSRLC